LIAVPVIAVIVFILVTYLIKCQFHSIIVDSANAKPHWAFVDVKLRCCQVVNSTSFCRPC